MFTLLDYLLSIMVCFMVGVVLGVLSAFRDWKLSTKNYIKLILALERLRQYLESDKVDIEEVKRRVEVIIEKVENLFDYK